MLHKASLASQRGAPRQPRPPPLALYSRQECLINTLRPASSWLSLLKFFCRKHRGPSHEGPSNFLNRVPSGALFKHYQYAQSVKFRGESRGWEIYIKKKEEKTAKTSPPYFPRKYFQPPIIMLSRRNSPERSLASTWIPRVLKTYEIDLRHDGVDHIIEYVHFYNKRAECKQNIHRMISGDKILRRIDAASVIDLALQRFSASNLIGSFIFANYVRKEINRRANSRELHLLC